MDPYWVNMNKTISTSILFVDFRRVFCESMNCVLCQKITSNQNEFKKNESKRPENKNHGIFLMAREKQQPIAIFPISTQLNFALVCCYLLFIIRSSSQSTLVTQSLCIDGCKCNVPVVKIIVNLIHYGTM